MSFAVFDHTHLEGLICVTPAEEISLTDEMAYFDNSFKKVRRFSSMTGLEKRRIAPRGVTASDLCLQAAEILLERCEADRNAIDALIFVSHCPDYLFPASAFLQHGSLGLSRHCAAFDVTLGCAGYVYGLWLASCMIESRACRKVLVLAGNSGSIDLDCGNRITAPLFGDAGTATLLEYSPQPRRKSFSWGSDGNGALALVRPGGGARLPDFSHENATDDPYYQSIIGASGNPWRVGGAGNIWMDGMEIYTFSLDVVPEHIHEHMRLAGMTPEAIDRLVLHQANKQIIQAVAEKAGFPLAKAPWETLGKYGNQACASIPCVMGDQLEAACCGDETHTLLLCGFGVGLSWASCIGDFSGMACCELLDYSPPRDIPSRKEIIAFWHEKFKKA